MNKSIKRKWVKALRSGEYIQGEGHLCYRDDNGDSFCCLGVLTDLYLIEKGLGWHQARATAYDDKNVLTYGKAGDLLPKPVAKWAGFDKDELEPDTNIISGKLITNSYDVIANSSTLSTINDEGETFDFIADVIENEL